MNKYKPTAFKFVEGEGYGTLHCPTIEIAQKVIQKEIDDDLEKHEVKIEDIKEDVMYRCKECEMFTIGESCCFECGESLFSRARRVFVYYLTPYSHDTD